MPLSNSFAIVQNCFFVVVVVVAVVVVVFFFFDYPNAVCEHKGDLQLVFTSFQLTFTWFKHNRCHVLQCCSVVTIRHG